MNTIMFLKQTKIIKYEQIRSECFCACEHTHNDAYCKCIKYTKTTDKKKEEHAD